MKNNSDPQIHHIRDFVCVNFVFYRLIIAWLSGEGSWSSTRVYTNNETLWYTRSGVAASHKVPNTQNNRPETTHGPRTACCYRQICYPAEFPIFALKIFKPIFLRENILTFKIKSNELEAEH